MVHNLTKFFFSKEVVIWQHFLENYSIFLLLICMFNNLTNDVRPIYKVKNIK